MNFPKQGDFFRVKFSNGDRSWRENLWMCIAATDAEIQGVILDKGWARGKPKLLTRSEVEFCNPGPFFGHVLLND